MSVHSFDEALGFSGSNGQYQVTVDGRWEAQPGHVFGGFLLAIVLRGAGLVSAVERPLSLACQFLRPTPVGVPLDVSVVSVRRGRTNELLTVTVAQSGKSVAEAQVRSVDPGSGPVYQPTRRPELGDPLSSRTANEVLRAAGTEPSHIFDQLEARQSTVPDDCDFTSWWRLGPGVTYGDAYVEAGRLALSTDNAGAAVMRRLHAFESGHQVLQWGFSNVDALMHFHQPFGTEWLYNESRIVAGSSGYVGVQDQTWSSTGELLVTVQSQLAFFDLTGGRAILRNATT